MIFSNTNYDSFVQFDLQHKCYVQTPTMKALYIHLNGAFSMCVYTTSVPWKTDGKHKAWQWEEETKIYTLCQKSIVTCHSCL